VIIVVPGPATPVTTPLVDTTATDGVRLLHAPPEGVDERLVVPPTHTWFTPEIVDGEGVTVTTAVVVQPEVIV
jgi:hypothetical protein